MSPRRELLAFGATLAALLGAVLHESLIGGRVLSPADVLLATPGFGAGSDYEPANRLLIDPVLQFQPWLEFNRAEIRQGRLPLWNPLAGCGAPHLANGQSAVFDPFHLIAYLGRLPDAYAWMALARLWFAGLGMFLLARRWGLGAWGRWFAGLTFPLCGFLVVWLLYPVTASAAWLPWIFLATEAVLDRPARRPAAALAVAVGGMLLGGHIQTAAHGLLAAGAYALWRIAIWPQPAGATRMARSWLGSVILGCGLAAIAIIPLGCYLARSPVWEDRQAERAAAGWRSQPRWLDSVCTAIPYAFGSQRRGHPNLARALGVHNLNESAGGFAGLATLLVLAPAAWAARRSNPRVRFLVALSLVGALGAFDIPPVANALRVLPVLEVIDHRRLTMWVAFGLVLLGGIGLDALASWRPRTGPRAWALGAAACLLAAVAFDPLFEAKVRARALAHYDRAAASTPGADPAAFRERAERQARQTLAFVPRYAGLVAAQLAALSALAALRRRGRIGVNPTRAALLGLALADLLGFGSGLNPAIPRRDHQPPSDLIEDLRRHAAPPSRVLGLGTALPPNVAMRYGLADVRNYDSVESARNLAHFADLYEPAPSRTSRREITWHGVARARGRLRAARVAAVVGPTPPPRGLFDRVDRVAGLWVGRWTTEPMLLERESPGTMRVALSGGGPQRVVVPETYDPGWRAEADGRPVAVEAQRGAFLAVTAPAGTRRVVLRYDPPEVRVAAAISLAAAVVIVLMIVAARPRRSGRKSRSGSWSAPRGRVKIGAMPSTRFSSPAPTEGRDADGPLHV